MNRQKMSIRDLDFNNTGAWPREYKLGFCAIVVVVIVGLAWWLFVRDQTDELAGLEGQESELRAEFETKQGRAANLEPLKLRQLPSKTEMPDLIIDISQTALATGLSSELFRPGPETPKEFYAEKPITLRMVGSYHQFGAFVSGVASLPRVVILTMHDISLKPRGNPGGGIRRDVPLELSGTVKTYRYLDEEETSAQAQAAAKGGR